MEWLGADRRFRGSTRKQALRACLAEGRAAAWSFLVNTRAAQKDINDSVWAAIRAIRELGAQEGIDIDKLDKVINQAVKSAVGDGIEVEGTVQLSRKEIEDMNPEKDTE